MRKLAALVALSGLFFLSSCEQLCESNITLPEIVISSPLNGMRISGKVLIKTVASSSVGIEKVGFYINGDLKESVTNSPYQYEWDTRHYDDGKYNLLCKAVDKNGNEKLSQQITVTVDNCLFKVIVSDNWLANRGKVILFISDNNGELLAETQITQDGEYKLSTTKDLTDINEISVSMTNDNYYGTAITTYMNIPTGSVWKLKGHKIPENYFEAELDFTNTPEYNDYVISSKWSNRYYYGTISGPFVFRENPTDIYLKLDTPSGVKYKWIRSVHDGSELIVNLENMYMTIEKNITGFSENNIGVQSYFEGLFENNYWARQLLDRKVVNENISSISVHYPPGDFEKFSSSFAEMFETNNFGYNYYTKKGEIPEQFVKINADFDFVSDEPDNFKIEAYGDFLKIRSIWKNGNSGLLWYVFSDKTTSNYKLPEFPQSIIDEFHFDRTDFYLYKTSLINHSDLSSYQDIIDIKFIRAENFYEVVGDYLNITKYYDEKSVTAEQILEEELSEEKLK